MTLTTLRPTGEARGHHSISHRSAKSWPGVARGERSPLTGLGCPAGVGPAGLVGWCVVAARGASARRVVSLAGQTTETTATGWAWRLLASHPLVAGFGVSLRGRSLGEVRCDRLRRSNNLIHGFCRVYPLGRKSVLIQTLALWVVARRGGVDNAPFGRRPLTPANPTTAELRL